MRYNILKNIYIYISCGIHLSVKIMHSIISITNLEIDVALDPNSNSLLYSIFSI